MLNIKTSNYICMCSNMYGVAMKPFSSDKMPPINEFKEIAVKLGIWQEKDEILIHKLDDITNSFIFDVTITVPA